MATTGHENEAVKISGLKANEKKLVNLLPFNEVICSTAAATAAKVANTTPASFNLVAKATIVVKFTYGITVANATFQVGTTAAKPIYYKGAALPANLVKAGMTVTLRYDGTNYNIVGTLDNETDISYDSTNKKITKTINGTTSDVVTSEKVVEDGGGMNLVEGYYYNKKFYKEAAHTTEITGADGRIYIDKDTNREYRFDGTKYVLLKSEVDGSFVSESTFTYRPTAGALDVESGAVGEGGAQIECIKGNTIAWNQLTQNPSFDAGTDNWHGTGETSLSVANSTLTLTKAGNWNGFAQSLNAINGHQYLIIIRAKKIIDTLQFTILFNKDSNWSTASSVTLTDEYSIQKSKLTVNADFTSLVFFLRNASTVENVPVAKVDYINLIDLTLIYGEGNEPSTVEQFEADYQKWFGKPLTYEEYDAGSLRSVEMTGIKTTGFNQWDEEIEDGIYNSSTGMKETHNLYARSKNYIPVISGQSYYFNTPASIEIFYYDKEKNYIGHYGSPVVQAYITIPNSVAFITFCSYYNAHKSVFLPYNHDICINISHSGDRNGDYEPYWEHTASLPVTQLKGKLNGEGSSVVVFPDGMKKAGTVYDEIVKRGNQTVAIKRIGSVDLGNKDYANYFVNGFKADIADLKIPKNVCCSLYLQNEYQLFPSIGQTYFDPLDDKVIYSFVMNGQLQKAILIKDTAYSNAATFKTAMQGVMLYYELATPQEYIIDDIDFPTEYPVDDYGTEEILSDSAKSLAPTLDIRYGLNATDTLRNLPSKYVSAVEEQNFTEAQKARARNNIGVISQEQLDALTRHTRKSDFSLDVLKQAVADQNLEKYGLKVGDYKTINGHDYVIAGLNCMKGTDRYTCTTDHVGLIVIPHTTQAWNASGNTYTGSDNRGAGYLNSDLHYYLKNTLLPLVNTDLGANNLLGHSKLLSKAVNQNGVNRFGEATGCASDWSWEADCKICALSEVQLYGSIVWSSSGKDTGEANQQLEVFRCYKFTEIFKDEGFWLRDVVSSSNASLALQYGHAWPDPASIAHYVAALILFH